MSLLDNCCCGFSLSKAAKMIAIVGMMLSLVSFGFTYFHPTYLIPALASLVTNVLLFLGSRAKNRSLVLVWLIFAPFEIVAMFVFFVWCVVRSVNRGRKELVHTGWTKSSSHYYGDRGDMTCEYRERDENLDWAAWLASITAIIVITCIYFWFVILSFFRELQVSKAGGNKGEEAAPAAAAGDRQHQLEEVSIRNAEVVENVYEKVDELKKP